MNKAAKVMVPDDNCLCTFSHSIKRIDKETIDSIYTYQTNNWNGKIIWV